MFRGKAPATVTAAWLAGLALLWSASGASAVSIELKDSAPDRIERQRAAAEGRLPLPGTPDVARLPERLAALNLKPGAPILMRIFKAQSELELWIEKDGTYVLFAVYPICHWSGTLGPKLQEGDRQTPEGFYTITGSQLHRLGRWTRALNLGFPNAYDQALKRDGSYILVHGGCSSVGCFAMTNPVIDEIYLLTSAALKGGQRYVPVHVFPFRMSDENMALHQANPWYEFWQNLKEGYDAFERTRRPPYVSVCDNRYRIQEMSPVEVGAASPLAVCGGTAAALRDLGKSAWLVRLPSSSQPEPRPSVLPETPLSPAARHPTLLPSSPTGRGSRGQRQESALAIEPTALYELIPNLAAPSLPAPNPCSPKRASCRHFLAQPGNGDAGAIPKVASAQTARRPGAVKAR